VIDAEIGLVPRMAKVVEVRALCSAKAQGSVRTPGAVRNLRERDERSLPETSCSKVPHLWILPLLRRWQPGGRRGTAPGTYDAC
jgi:uncharacterized protein (DUF849 family)